MKNKKDKQIPTAIIITDDAKDNVFVDCNVNGAIEIEKRAENNKFINTDISASISPPKKWHEKTLWKTAIMVAASLLVAYLVYRFGWK